MNNFTYWQKYLSTVKRISHVLTVKHGFLIVVLQLMFGELQTSLGGDCSHEIKRHLLLGRKTMTDLDRILKSRDITLPTKVHPVKAMVFPVVMDGWKSWIIKKAEPWGTDAFELWCWSRLLRVPWTARRSNQWILKKISPEYSLERLMLKLKLQHIGHLMRRTDSLEKTLMLGKIEGRNRAVTHNYWAHVRQLLKPPCLEPVLRNKRSLHSEQPVLRNKRIALTHHNQRRPVCGNEDPVQPN